MSRVWEGGWPRRPNLVRVGIKQRLAGISLALLGACAYLAMPAAQARAPLFQASWDGQAVRLQWGHRGWVSIERSTSRRPDPEPRPVRHWTVNADAYNDDRVASGVSYTYTLTSGGASSSLEIAIPAKTLPASQHPRLLVDKRNYTLEVWSGQKLLKRYPIAMGRAPAKRKLAFDNESTPEGRYHIIGLQPQATYYRAYDIDYPNTADKARHQLLHCAADIGGEIEIHGRGIGRNWTFGCMALRDADIDELFAHPEIGVGTELWIYGGETELADIKSDATSTLPPLELGKKQRERGLKVTCLYDVATRARIR